MKRIFALTAFMLAFLMLLRTPALAVEARADVRLKTVPVLQSNGETILEIDLSVLNGSQDSSISNVELVFDNGTIAAQDEIFGGEKVFLRTAPLDLSRLEQADIIPITLYYTDFDGAPMEYNYNVSVNGVTGEPSLKFSRTAEPLPQSSKVRLSYVLENDGEVPLTNLTVKDSVAASDVAFVDFLDVGQKKTVTLDVEVTADTVSKPQVSYAPALGGSGKVYQLSLEALTLSPGEPHLTLSLKSDLSSVFFGEKATLTLSVTNDGNVPFSSVTVSDATIGSAGESAPMQVGKVSTYTKIVNPESTTDYLFTAIALDGEGNSYTFSSDPLCVEVLPAQTAQPADLLTLSVEAALTKLDAPGEVNFSFVVRNAGQTPLEQLTISDGRGNVLTRTSVLEPGAQAFSISISVTESTSFAFLAEAKLQDGTPLHTSCDPLQIQVAPPIAEPEIADEEQAILPDAAGNSILLTPWLLGLFVFLILLIIACIAALILLQVRARRRRDQQEKYETESLYSEDREVRGARFDYSPSEEEAREQISHFARQYSRSAAGRPSAPEYPQREEEDEPTVYKASPASSAGRRQEPRTRQDYHLK